MEKSSGETTPASITEQILKYLKEQQGFNAEDEGAYLCRGQSGLVTVRGILQELVQKIEDRGQFIEQFQARLLAHNQYPLFNLGTIISDFYIDDELYTKLSFRETLVISSFADDPLSLVPKSVGGLCLDIQLAKGKSPLTRKDAGLEQKIMELLTSVMNETKREELPKVESAADLSNISEKPSMSPSERELEEFEASIRPKYEQSYCKFLVHVSSQFDAEGNSGGSRISAWVDRNFHTLEEKRREYVTSAGVSNEKSLYCALQPRRYYVSHKSSPDKIVDRKYYSMTKTRDLVCEGANFVLMRYLAITRYMGKFELSTMYINGDMCRNIYQCFGPESGIVNDQKLDLCRIYRTIVEECGITHNCCTLLTLSGQLIKQEWTDCQYVLQLNPLAKVSNEAPKGNEHLLLEKIWEKDMQLFSMFLDNKSTCHLQIKSYLADHQEFKSMMADYIQTALLMKPENVLDFTVKHFTKYYSKRFDRRYVMEEEAEAEGEDECCI